MPTDDRDYLLRRARQERARAAAAGDPAAASAHQRLAQEYERRARELAHELSE